MNVINLTPHDVNIVGDVNRTYPRSGDLVRLRTIVKDCDPLPDGTPTTRTVFLDPQGLPDYQEGTYYIVSQLVKSALPDRTDLLVPADVVRDDSGNIVGCRSLGR